MPKLLKVELLDLALLGQHLTASGDILLYGCDVAQGYLGQEFIDLLANTTSADIAASDDATGSYISSANFNLEATTGTVETPSLSYDTNVATFRGY